MSPGPGPLNPSQRAWRRVTSLNVRADSTTQKPILPSDAFSRPFNFSTAQRSFPVLSRGSGFRYAGLPGGRLGDSLAETALLHRGAHYIGPGNCGDGTRSKLRLETRSLLFQIFLSFQELALSRLAHFEPSRLRCHGHSLLLSSYLYAG